MERRELVARGSRLIEANAYSTTSEAEARIARSRADISRRYCLAPYPLKF
jgi:hypothetical protein